MLLPCAATQLFHIFRPLTDHAVVWLVQIEPDRWYYHCDRLGMLVWQDMPRCGSPALHM
jgi:hypothetical protein